MLVETDASESRGGVDANESTKRQQEQSQKPNATWCSG